MNDQRIAILTDSGTDVPADFAAEHDIRVVPLAINYFDGTYLAGVDITTEEVIARFDTEPIPTTSLPSPSRIEEALRAAQADGYEKAVFVTIASALSTTFNTVQLVASGMPEFPVYAVDSKNIGVSGGMVAMQAARWAEEGVPFEELGPRLDALSCDTDVWFSVKTLEWLRHGGRITEAVYRLGKVLNICPVIHCNDEGYYHAVKKARGWERSLEAMMQLAIATAAKYEKVRLAFCWSPDDVLTDEFQQRAIDAMGNVVEVIRTGIKPDLIVHTGPHMVGMSVQRA